MRETLLFNAIKLLEQKGFIVEPFFHSNTCFDLAARKGSTTVLVKVFNNVDALREEHAIEIKKLVNLFNAIAVVIGNKTKAFILKPNVVYERYGIPTVSIQSFAGMLEGNFPIVKSFKGKEIVELDSDALRRKRKELGLTLSELASKIDTSIESVHRYEKGHSASLEAAEKLEKVLGAGLVKKVDLFESTGHLQETIFDDVMPDPALEKVHDLGLKLALFKHAPFKAGSSPSERLLISRSETKRDVKRKALELHKTRIVFDGKGMVIASKTKFRVVGDVPVVEEEELTTLSKFRDLKKLLQEREKESEI